MRKWNIIYVHILFPIFIAIYDAVVAKNTTDDYATEYNQNVIGVVCDNGINTLQRNQRKKKWFILKMVNLFILVMYTQNQQLFDLSLGDLSKC